MCNVLKMCVVDIFVAAACERSQFQSFFVDCFVFLLVFLSDVAWHRDPLKSDSNKMGRINYFPEIRCPINNTENVIFVSAQKKFLKF